MTTLREAAQMALDAFEYRYTTPEGRAAIEALRAALATEQEPVAWRDHVEQRLLTWRQSFVNKSGDQLALDDFMDKESLDDLIDFVCDEYTSPPASKPKTEAFIKYAWANSSANIGFGEFLSLFRAIEAAHGIKGDA